MTDSQNLTQLSRVARRHPWSCAWAALVAASIAGASCADSAATDAAPVEETSSATAATPAGIHLSSEAMQAGGIAVEAARTERRSGYFETPAVLQLDETRTARIGSIVEGVVVSANVQAGTRVGRNARLAEIHSHMVHEAWAEYRRAMAERRRAASELEYVKDAEGRALRLLATKAVSRQEAERAAPTAALRSRAW